jgi:hypothetical protein
MGGFVLRSWTAWQSVINALECQPNFANRVPKLGRDPGATTWDIQLLQDMCDLATACARTRLRAGPTSRRSRSTVSRDTSSTPGSCTPPSSPVSARQARPGLRILRPISAPAGVLRSVGSKHAAPSPRAPSGHPHPRSCRAHAASHQAQRLRLRGDYHGDTGRAHGWLPAQPLARSSRRAGQPSSRRVDSPAAFVTAARGL